jgi:uncharacterized membrane protein YhaH (DUF805 family)
MEPEIVIRKSSWSFNPFSYKGRIGRLNYFLGLFLVSLVLTILGIFVFIFGFSFFLTFLMSSLAKNTSIVAILFLPVLLGLIIALVSIWFTSSFIVRRYHDLGKSGKWCFALLIPLYNIHLAIGLLIERGTVGLNQYGEDPIPNADLNDLAHRLSQNTVFRIIAFFVLLVFCILGIFGRVNQRIGLNQQKQNMINQVVQSVACGDSTSTPEQLLTPDKTWKTYTSPKLGSVSGFSFQYPTTYTNINNINLVATPQDSIGIITESPNPDIAGLVDIGVNVSAANGLSDEQILSMNEYSGRTYAIKDFETNSGIIGKEMIVKMNNPSACGGSQITSTKILFNFPQSSGESNVIVFNFEMWALKSNNIVESISKTFTFQNSVSSNQGSNTPGKATVTTGIYPLGCYTITYDPESLIANKDEVHEGIISFTDAKGNPVFDVAPSGLGDVNTVTTQIASQFSPKPAVQDFVTTSGIKGKELVGSNWWEILVPTASQQNGDTIILNIGSSNLNNLKSGKIVAKSVSSKLNCE